MHDGSIASLEEVVDFYDRGGYSHANKDERLKPLQLSQTEKKQLISFLKTLTDWNFVQNKSFAPAL